ncbi:MAG: hypothetical protein SNF68_01870 [Rikenellaceae bacterium]
MKKTAVILTSFIGGAAVGAATAMFLAPKTGVEMQKDAKAMIFDHIKQIQEHMKKCSCMMGLCDCDKEKSENPMVESNDPGANI